MPFMHSIINGAMVFFVLPSLYDLGLNWTINGRHWNHGRWTSGGTKAQRQRKWYAKFGILQPAATREGNRRPILEFCNRTHARKNTIKTTRGYHNSPIKSNKINANPTIKSTVHIHYPPSMKYNNQTLTKKSGKKIVKKKTICHVRAGELAGTG